MEMERDDRCSRARGERRGGFSLIELMLVVVVLGILAAIVLPRFADQGSRGKDAGRARNLRLLRDAVARFHNDTDLFPSSLADLTLARTSPPQKGLDDTGAAVGLRPSDYNGPYIDGLIPNDPTTGAPFSYSTSSPQVGEVDPSSRGGGALAVPGPGSVVLGP